jgi:hypothetical protein
MADTIPVPGADRPPRGERKPRAKPRAQQPPRRDATSSGREGDTPDGSADSPPLTRPRRRSSADRRILESLTGMYGMVGAGIAGVGQVQGNAGLLAAGINVTVQGETLAGQWLDLAEEVPAVRRALEGMLKGGAVSVVVMGNAGIALPILAAAGIIPQQVGNMFLAPEAVEAGMAYQAQQQAAAAAANGTPGA